MKNNLIMASRILIIFVLSSLLVSCSDQPAQGSSSDVAAEKQHEKLTVNTEDRLNIPAENVSKTINTKPVKITKQDFLVKVMDYEKNPDKWIFKGELPCLIDFYADWCAPCRITSPILEELAESYAGKINIYKIDIEAERELSSLFGIRSIPAFLYCPVEGRPSLTSGIARTTEETRQLFINQIESLLLNRGIAP
jgi:thioredoxin